MFSPDIVCSDAFLDLPSSARDLYYQLGMYADDDGFVNPRKIMRMIGSSEDDLKLLIAKRFVIPFPSGVLVIKHWKINNLVRKDWYRPTLYQEEMAQLVVKENNRYSLVNEPLTEVRLGKDRLLGESEIRVESVPSKEEEKPQTPDRRVKDKEAVYAIFSPKKEGWMNYKQERVAALRLFDRGIEKVRRGKEIMREYENDRFCPQADTPTEYEKKLPALRRFVKRNGITL